MRLHGTMLTPGVSKNNRLYTAENIAKAHARLTERLASGQPVTMLTHHAAGDDSTRIVGRVTAVTLNGDNLDYEAELADTTEAQTIGALVSPAEPFLRNVSIRGAWAAPVGTVIVDGRPVETADDLDIDGLDFTKNPGVTGATVAVVAGAAETAVQRHAITESVEAQAVFTEDAPVGEANKEPHGNVTYADPGYQDDKVKRYPIDTKAHAKAAWSYINQKDNAALYTAAQLKRIKGRIKSALKKFGVTVTAESLDQIATLAPEVHMLTETAPTLGECIACVDGTGTAGFSISAFNGPLTVTVSAYNGVEPADLGSVAMCAMQAAVDAIHALDPDDDGDIDQGADSDDKTDDDQMETHEEEAAVAETTEATEADSTDTPEAPAFVTADQLQAAVTAAVQAALAPKDESTESAEDGPLEETEQTDETADETVETVDETALREQIRLEERAALIEQARKDGTLTRKGLVEAISKPGKQLHEMNDDEWRAYQQERSAVFFAHNPQ